MVDKIWFRMSSSRKGTPETRELRSNSIPSKEEHLTLAKFEDIVNRKFQEMETRLSSKLDTILNKITVIETRIDGIESEQIRANLEVDKIKEVVIEQQCMIEKHEAIQRSCNLVISGISESPIEYGEEILQDDQSKVREIYNLTSDELGDDLQITNCSRIGPRSSTKPRLLKVVLANKTDRNTMLYSQKKMRSDVEFRKAFGKIFINPDSTFLVRKEEKRLREIMKTLKQSSQDDDTFYIKSGRLFHNSVMIDKVDIRKQLF